jgi:DNA uptake protein ComE-like DNA-binding protein
MREERAHGGAARRRGMALVTVLWLVTILSAVALDLSLFVRLRVQLTRNEGEGMEALFAARSGVARAMAELQESRDTVTSLDGVREAPDRTYHSVVVGRGSYTLLADGRNPVGGLLEYGLRDEAALINVNTAEAETLAHVPGIDAELAGLIVALRQEAEHIDDLADLLAIEAMDPRRLYGEDQNLNALLDPWEDDVDERWPPDNGDGYLDGGLAVWLTCRSAVRNVTAEGEERLNINSADVAEIVEGLPGVSQEQATAIVEHRKGEEFSSIAGLLDVVLVEEAEQGGEGEPEDATGGRPPDGQPSGGPQGGRGGSDGEAAEPESPPEAEPEGRGESTYRPTGEKAFDRAALRGIVDLITVTEDEVLAGLVNLNTASEEVLVCLPGMDERTARAIVVRRQEAPLQSVGDLLQMDEVRVEDFRQCCDRVSVRSDVLSVRSFGVAGGGEGWGSAAQRCVLALIDRTGDRVRLSSWRELD